MRKIRLPRKASERLAAGHVWVYRGELPPDITAETCETALLLDERGRLLGSALVDGAAHVPVRLYARREVALDAALVAERLAQAFAWRRRVVGPESTGYRMVFSESDGVPGLIVDRFGDGVALQLGMRNYVSLRESIVAALKSEVSGLSAVVSEESEERKLVLGDVAATRVVYQLNGLAFEADLLEGPKTGAFLDQRENYLAVADWARRLGLGAGRALDLFSSSGGFALHLARVMASVDAVDSAAWAVARIGANAQRNGIGNVRAIDADVKQYLRGLGQARRRYECVVVDPPAFAKQQKQMKEATRAYLELNLKALAAVAPDGLFVTCSCSRAMTEDQLLSVVAEAAHESRKQLTLLEKRVQPSDHKVLLPVPESNYLKCLIFAVSASS